MAILSFISAGFMIIFSFLLGTFRSRLYDYWWYESLNFFQNALTVIFNIFSFISMLACIALFIYIGIKLISGRRIKIEVIYLALGLSIIPEILRTISTLLFVGVSDAFWVFIHQFIGYSYYGNYIYDLIVSVFAGLFSHAIALVLLILTIKNKYLLNTLPVGSNLVKTSRVINKAQSLYRECPFCAETILAKANLCKHCKSKI